MKLYQRSSAGHPEEFLHRRGWQTLGWIAQEGGVTIPGDVQETAGCGTPVPSWQGDSQSKFGLNNLRGLFQSKQFCRFMIQYHSQQSGFSKQDLSEYELAALLVKKW